MGAVLLTLTAAAPAQAVAYAQIEGSGSSWSEVIVQQWISDVDAYGMKVTYQGSGSSQGRKDFAANVTDFGISEIPYQGTDEFGNADNANGRDFAYLPIVAGGTAFTYQLRIGGKQVKNLRLSGATIAKIFTNQITNWSDPAIKADNNGRILPSLPITPVVRSDGSGTTAQFTAYLDHEYPSIWRAFYGRSGMTSYFPRRGRAIAASKSDQVMNTISSAAGNGTIGYVEYSYPVNAAYPVVKVLNRGGYFVEPTQYNVAVALTKARINQDKTSQNYLTQILTDVYTASDPRAYPLSSYSYMLIPTGAKDVRMTTAKRQTLADFMFYSLCQGQTKAGGYGYSPLPLNLVQAGFEQLGKLKAADPAIDIKNRDVRSCNNPTFNGRDLGTNRLAQIAPAPATCDKAGQGPCGSPTGTGAPTTNQSEARNGGAAAAGAGTTGAATATG
ncbi:MAG: phosphate ABC transporter substrate-binding protein PstS, partial [Dermatophilaceae bacterium]|nr:phosphate ABC transporter substrate-binding protein PstS [Dermatophilaceae bacterium]